MTPSDTCPSCRYGATLKGREPPPALEVPTKMYRTGFRIITVAVGQGDTGGTFVVEEPLLTAASPYFKNALKQTFKEGLDSRVVKEEDPQIFGLLNEYLHHGSIKGDTTMVEYCRLWLLAHYLQISPLMDYSMWRLLDN